MKKLTTYSLQGLHGTLVQIEVDIHRGLPSFSIVGLGDTSIQESKERIRSAIKNTGYHYPRDRITCNLAPANTKKTGTHFDLPIAIGIILNEQEEAPERLNNTLFVGELALSGEIRKIRGILPIILCAIADGWKNIVLPLENLSETRGISGIQIIPVQTLTEAVEWVGSGTYPGTHLANTNFGRNDSGVDERARYNSQKTETSVLGNILHAPYNGEKEKHSGTLLESIHGHENIKRALVISAAGGHNILLEGSPGSGKSMLINALQGILPPLSPQERLEVGQIYSVAGELNDISTVSRPFRKLHPTTSLASLIGGGRSARPGEVSLAHRGVLFFDELLEFDKKLLESLREPLESGVIQISRSDGKYTYPANFIFAGAMNPCPCGYHLDPQKTCIDSKRDIEGYRSKLSGPILDRIDIHLRVSRPTTPHQTQKTQTQKNQITTQSAREIIIAARNRSVDLRGKINADLTAHETDSLKISVTGLGLLKNAVSSLHLSMRAYHRILRISQTISDIESSDIIQEDHIIEALGYRMN